MTGQEETDDDLDAAVERVGDAFAGVAFEDVRTAASSIIGVAFFAFADVAEERYGLSVLQAAEVWNAAVRENIALQQATINARTERH